jgi:hypothetical protein
VLAPIECTEDTGSGVQGQQGVCSIMGSEGEYRKEQRSNYCKAVPRTKGVPSTEYKGATKYKEVRQSIKRDLQWGD